MAPERVRGTYCPTPRSRYVNHHTVATNFPIAFDVFSVSLFDISSLKDYQGSDRPFRRIMREESSLLKSEYLAENAENADNHLVQSTFSA